MSGLPKTLAAIGAAAACLTFVAASAPAATTSSNSQGCFLANDWRGWKSPSPNVIYLRVSANQIWRLDLSAGSSQLQSPGMHLVSQLRGSDWVCSAIDLDLELADDHGITREPLFVKAITRLSPDEAKAIPREFQP